MKNRSSTENQNFSSFSVNFQFRVEVKKVTSRAELEILQLELWLEPARLGLITNIQSLLVFYRESDEANLQALLSKSLIYAKEDPFLRIRFYSKTQV